MPDRRSPAQRARLTWPFSGAFSQLWLGQLVSTVGSGITSFGLSVWVYQQTGSATQFAFVLTFATLPLVVLWPVAGVVADGGTGVGL